MKSVKTTGIVDTIIRLAEEIGRTAPECATKAMQIAELARELDSAPDQATVKDALDAQSLDDDLSDVDTQCAASAVVRALKE
jgi:hypothetical protein